MSQTGLSDHQCPSTKGHSYTAYGVGGRDGALVVDLAMLQAVTVNTQNGQATVQTGNRLGDMAIALYAQGRALSHGTCPWVGTGGHISAGGYGMLARHYGITLDSVIGHQVVLANGSIVTTSASENSELFWVCSLIDIGPVD